SRRPAWHPRPSRGRRRIPRGDHPGLVEGQDLRGSLRSESADANLSGTQELITQPVAAQHLLDYVPVLRRIVHVDGADCLAVVGIEGLAEHVNRLDPEALQAAAEQARGHRNPFDQRLRSAAAGGGLDRALEVVENLEQRRYDVALLEVEPPAEI